MKLGLSNEPRPPDWGIEQTGRMPSLGNSNQQGNWLESRRVRLLETSSASYWTLVP
jgi:hypothetical protein